VSYTEAKVACEAAGFRLCRQDEWQTACEGGTGNTYAYPYLWMAGYSEYEPDVCNGNDYDYNCTGLDDDDVLPTGMVYTDCVTGPSDCISLDGILDLSGNLMEWTSTLASGKTDIYHVRGGSFLTHEWGLTCQASFVTLKQTFRYDDLGFRCCSDTAP
jgi:formylglycine-generating enzyme required for sulfatase activity